MNINLASTPVADVDHLPWWGQLSLAVGLLVLASGLNWLDQRDRNDDDDERGFAGLVAYCCGIAAFILAVKALFF